MLNSFHDIDSKKFILSNIFFFQFLTAGLHLYAFTRMLHGRMSMFLLFIDPNTKLTKICTNKILKLAHCNFLLQYNINVCRLHFLQNDRGNSTLTNKNTFFFFRYIMAEEKMSVACVCSHSSIV